MQLAKLDRTVTSGGIAQQRKMGMVLDGVAFKILSDGLYSDKIGSVVREVYSNAIDSHTMAGEPKKPAWIQIPNSLDPTFIVRDEGIGLDEEGVLETATTYFGSTKRSDNQNIGGFGLGFKSPFAYTDSWTIVATKDGVKRTFSAYMTELGEPNVALLTSEPTDSPNGVEVRVPVRQQDIHRFREAVAKQLQYFDPRPHITGAAIEFPDKQVIVEGEGYKITKGSHNHNRWTAVIGPVGFPLDTHQLRDKLSEKNNTLIANLQGELFFEVGELLPSPSREALQYDTKAIELISKRLSKIADDYMVEIQKKVDACGTFWEACLKYDEIMRNSEHYVSRLMVGMKWRGGQEVGQFVDITSTNPVEYKSYRRYELDQERITIGSLPASKTFSLRCEQGVFILVDDLPSPYHRQSTRVKQAYVELIKNTHNSSYIYFWRGNASDIDELLKQLDGFPKENVIYLSTVELPEAPKAAVGGKTRSLPGLRMLRRHAVTETPYSKSSMDRVTDEIKGSVTPGFYLISENNCPHTSGLDFVQICRNDEDFLPGDIVIVPKSISQRISADDGWVEFSAAYKEKFEAELKDAENDFNLYAQATAPDEYRNNMLTRVFKDLFVENHPAPARTSSPFWRAYRAYCEQKKIKLSDEQMARVKRFKNLTDDDTVTKRFKLFEQFSREAQNMEEQIKTQQPSLYEFLDRGSYRLSSSVVLDIVKKIA